MPRKSAAPVSGKEEAALLLEKLTYPDDFPLNISVVNMKEDPLHYHIDTELVYVLRGEIRLKNGYCSYDLQEGDVFTNSGHEVHSISALSEDNVVALIQVNTHYMSQYFPNLSKACYRTYSRKRADKKHDRLRELLLQILLKYEARSVNYKSECIYLAVELIKHLDKYFNLFIFDKNVVVGFDRGNQLAMERISRICQYIYQFYASNITLEDLSQMEHLSSFYISHLIKDFTGMNFRDFLCFARVEWSEIDLLGTEKKISQIANDVGFSTTAYYRKYFERWFGHSPQEYRDLYKNEVKSDLKPAIYDYIPAGRAVSLIKETYAAYTNKRGDGEALSSINFDIAVDVNAEPISSIRPKVIIDLSARDCENSAMSLASPLSTLEPDLVVLHDDPTVSAAQTERFTAILKEAGMQVENAPYQQIETRGIPALDSVIAAAGLLRDVCAEPNKDVRLWLQDDTETGGLPLAGLPSLITSTGDRKASYYAAQIVSTLQGDLLMQGNHCCVVRTDNKENAVYTMAAFNYSERLLDLLTRKMPQSQLRSAINDFRDELNISININLPPGIYAVAKFSMTKDNNIFGRYSALDFRPETFDFCRYGETPALETYIEDVRTLLNMNFSIKGVGLQLAVVRRLDEK